MRSSSVNDGNRLPPPDILRIASHLLIGHYRFWTTSGQSDYDLKISTSISAISLVYSQREVVIVSLIYLPLFLSRPILSHVCMYARCSEFLIRLTNHRLKTWLPSVISASDSLVPFILCQYLPVVSFRRAHRHTNVHLSYRMQNVQSFDCTVSRTKKSSLNHIYQLWHNLLFSFLYVCERELLEDPTRIATSTNQKLRIKDDSRKKIKTKLVNSARKILICADTDY